MKATVIKSSSTTGKIFHRRQVDVFFTHGEKHPKIEITTSTNGVYDTSVEIPAGELMGLIFSAIINKLPDVGR